jgi:uroporphyrin-III C-methyltransferase
VVRLKGGDPCLFGRDGEEAAFLRAAGIYVEVVPGITSGPAAPAAAGSSVTHRDASPGVISVTGPEKDDTNERIDWAALAASGLTPVIYMGVAKCARIQQRLLDGALVPDTPAAAIQHATLPQQHIVMTTLAALPTTLESEGIGSPAILVIGEVAGPARITAPWAAAQLTAAETRSVGQGHARANKAAGHIGAAS